MTSVRFASAVVLGTIVALAGCDGPPPPSARSVILVTLDTTRADRVGAYGGSTVPTPRLDSVAAGGVTFLDAFSQVPLTLPSHSSILTGRYPATHGVRHNGIFRLPEGEQTLAEQLAGEGFETAAFVAAYVLNRGYGTEQGFATYDDVPIDRFEGGRDQLFEAQRTADEVNARVFEWLDARAGRDDRVFLWVHYYDPHDPYEPPERDGRTLHGQGYDREISYLDHAFGDLLDRLRDDRLLERSILVVVGDHGESLGEHDERTHGIFLYDAVLRVPFLVRAPGLLPAGQRVGGPVELVDVAPTILDLLGMPGLDGADGRSLLPRVRGEEDGGSALAHAESLMSHIEFGWAELRAVHDGRFKYIEAPTPELYDVVADPGETANLAPNDPDRAGEMAALVATWRLATEQDSAPDQAVRELTAEELARLQSLGYMQAGVATYDHGVERPDPKDRIAELRALDDARDALADGRLDEALAGVDAILDTNPGNHNARMTRIAVLIEFGRYAEAENEARAGLTLATTGADPQPAVARKLQRFVGATLRIQGRTDEAEEVYRTMIGEDPDDDLAPVDLARMLAESGRPREALDLLAPVTARSPRDGMALAARFTAEFALGRREDALETARNLADARSGDAAALRQAADLLLKDGDPARAAAAFEVAQEQIDLDPVLLGRLGSARIAAGDLDGAEEVFRTLDALRPGDPRAPYFLATIALRRGDEAAARRWVDATLARDARFTGGLVALGSWLRGQGRGADARAVLEDALARNPADVAARRELEAIGRR